MSYLEDILNEQNINCSIAAIHKSNKSAGIDKMKARELHNYWNEHSAEILFAIVNMTYYPNYALGIAIKKKGSSAKRRLEIPTILDRMLLKAINNVLAPYFYPQFSESSYGFRPNHGIYDALFTALNYINTGYHTIIKIDIKGFFDHVHHNTLFHRLEEDIFDERLLILIKRFVKMKVSFKNYKYQKYEGLPQGSCLSPLLANLYLDVFDKYMELKKQIFIRYADDIVLFCKNYYDAENALLLCKNFLYSVLKLKVNSEKTIITSPEHLDFLSYTFRKTVNGKYQLSISTKTEQKMLEKMRRSILRSSKSHVAWWARQASFNRGWVNYFKYAEPEKMCLFLSYAEMIQHEAIKTYIASYSGLKSQALLNSLYDCPRFSTLTGWFFCNTLTLQKKDQNYIERMKLMSNKYAYVRSNYFYENREELLKQYSSITSTPFYYMKKKYQTDIVYPINSKKKKTGDSLELTDTHKAILYILAYNKTLTSWQIISYLFLRGICVPPETIYNLIEQLWHFGYVQPVQIINTEKEADCPSRSIECFHLTYSGYRQLDEFGIYRNHKFQNPPNREKFYRLFNHNSVLCNQIVINQLLYGQDIRFYNIEFRMNLQDCSAIIPLQIQTNETTKIYYFQKIMLSSNLRKTMYIWSKIQKKYDHTVHFILIVHSLCDISNGYDCLLKMLCMEYGLCSNQISISVASSWFLACHGIEIPLDKFYPSPLYAINEHSSPK